LFELGVYASNANSILAEVRKFTANDERSNSLRVLGYVLANWHASPDEAFRFQLSVIEALINWYPVGGAVYRLLLSPYVVQFWQLVAKERRIGAKGRIPAFPQGPCFFKLAHVRY
jgi:hypothetical protein